MKKKNRRSVWLCCSVIQAKNKKNKNMINTTHEEEQLQQPDQDFVSWIFGPNDDKNGRLKACICCSVVEELPPSSPRTAGSAFDMEVTNAPTTVVTGVPTGNKYG